MFFDRGYEDEVAPDRRGFNRCPGHGALVAL